MGKENYSMLLRRRNVIKAYGYKHSTDHCRLSELIKDLLTSAQHVYQGVIYVSTERVVSVSPMRRSSYATPAARVVHALVPFDERHPSNGGSIVTNEEVWHRQDLPSSVVCSRLVPVSARTARYSRDPTLTNNTLSSIGALRREQKTKNGRLTSTGCSKLQRRVLYSK